MNCTDVTNVPQYSYSRLTTYETCPYSYYITYILGDRGKNNGFAVAGSIAHDLIDQYYKGKYKEYELLYEFQKRWQEDFIDEGWRVKYYPAGKDFYLDWTDNYYNNFVNYFINFQAYENCEIIATELDKNYLIENDEQKIFFRGIIDCVAKDSHGYIVFDSKSKGKWKNELETQKYVRQLYCYSLFIKNMYGEYPKKLCFNQFRLTGKDRVTNIKFNLDDYHAAINWIFETVKEIKNDILWLPNVDEFFCRNLCNHYDKCCFANREASGIGEY